MHSPDGRAEVAKSTTITIQRTEVISAAILMVTNAKGTSIFVGSLFVARVVVVAVVFCSEEEETMIILSLSGVLLAIVCEPVHAYVYVMCVYGCVSVCESVFV